MSVCVYMCYKLKIVFSFSFADEFYDNKIRNSIGMSVMHPKHQQNDNSLWKQPGILAGKFQFAKKENKNC